MNRAIESLKSIVSKEFTIVELMAIHAVFCIVIGVFTVVIPHKFYDIINPDGVAIYNHLGHEYLRLYGALTLAVGWFSWRAREINDGRLTKYISETFFICYLLQALIMIRAQFTNPAGHSTLHWTIATVFVVLSLLYAYVRFVKKIKSYGLPGGHDL